MRQLFITLIIFSLLMNVKLQAQNMDKTSLKRWMGKDTAFNTYLKNADTLQIQILYTQVNRDKNNLPSFKSYSFNLNDQHYFYPASTVKLPAVIFSLEKLNSLKKPGLSAHSAMYTDSNFRKQTMVLTDSSAQNSKPSIAQYLKKILLVSDNDAFNRLYELLGRATTNQKLKQYGLTNSRIINRLSVGDDNETSRHTNPIKFYTDDKLVYEQPAVFDEQDYPLELTNLLRGVGYFEKGKLINKPFDFSNKNVFPLSDQQLLMKKLIFPEAFEANNRFNLTSEDYKLIYEYMSKYPTESDFPKYNPIDYYPTYCKFLYYGSLKNNIINPDLRIFNKVGDAYGYLIDNAYFVDYKNKVEFLLSAVIQCNSDGVYNDDKYEYDTVGFPFMKEIGELIYNMELKRKKKNLPDLSKFEPYR